MIFKKRLQKKCITFLFIYYEFILKQDAWKISRHLNILLAKVKNCNKHTKFVTE